MVVKHYNSESFFRFLRLWQHLNSIILCDKVHFKVYLGKSYSHAIFRKQELRETIVW